MSETPKKPKPGDKPDPRRKPPAGKRPPGKKPSTQAGSKPALRKTPSGQPPPSKPSFSPPASSGTLKKVMIVGGILTTLLVLIVGAFYLFVDLKEIEATLKQKLSEETGLKVEFDDLKFDFHEEFGLQATQLKIQSLDGKDHLLSAKKLFLKVKLMPLLDSKVEIKTLDLVEPEITVYLEDPPPVVKKNIPPPAPKATNKTKNPTPSPKTPVVPATKPETALDTVREVFRELELAVDSVQIENGNIAIVKRSGNKIMGKKNVRLSMETILERPDKNHLSLFLNNMDVTLDNLKIKGEIDVKDILGEKGRLETDLTLGAFNLDDLKTLNFFMEDDLGKILKPYTPSAQFDRVGVKMQTPLDTLEDTNALIQQAKVQAHLVGKDIVVTASGYTVPLKTMDTQLSWSAGNLKHTIQLATLGGTIEQKGDANLKNLLGKNIKTLLNTTTTLQKVNVHSLGLPKEWGITNATVSGTITVKGPPDLDKMSIKTNLKADAWFSELNLNDDWVLHQAKIHGQIEADGPTLPEKMNLHAAILGENIRISERKQGGMNIPITKLKTDTSIKGNSIHSVIKASIFGGEFSHQGDIQLPKPGNNDRTMMLDSKIEFANIDLHQLPIPMHDSLNGATLSGTATLKGPTDDLNRLQITSSLNGKANVVNLKLNEEWSLSKAAVDAKVTTSGAGDPAKMNIHATLGGQGIHLIGHAFNDLQIPIRRLDADATVKGKNIKSTITLGMMGGTIKQQGTVLLPKTDHKDAVPTINTHLDLNKIDMSQIQWPKEWGLSKAILSGDIHAKGPADPDRITLKGSIHGDNLHLTPPEKDITIQSAMVDINSKPPKMPITLDFKLSTLVAQKMPFQQFNGKVSLPKDKVLVHKSALFPPHGQVEAKGVYNTAEQTYDFFITGKELDLEDYDEKIIKGKAKFAARVKGVVLENEDPMRGLSGEAKLLVTEGSLKELGSVKAILSILNPTAISKLGEQGLVFDKLSGSYKITKGLVNTQNTALEGKFLKVYVKGDVNVPDQTLNLTGKALPMGDLDKLLKGVPLLGTLLAGNKKDEGLVETYFNVTGTFAEPKVDMEAAKSIIAKPKRVLEKLGDIFTGGSKKKK